MGLTKRKEYHWIDGRVVPLVVERPKGLGPWPGYDARCSTLVVAIEDQHGIFVTASPGPESSDSRLKDAVALHFGIEGLEQSPDIGTNVPEAVLNAIGAEVSEAVHRVTLLYQRHADEQATTGDLVGNLNFEREIQGWRVRVVGQGFSPQTKEPRVGADGGILVDLMDGEGHRIIKASWFQAKRTHHLPDNLDEIPDFREQVGKMEQRTAECYGVIYGPGGIRVFPRGRRDEETTLDQVITSMMRCERGDRRIQIVSETLDRSFLLELIATELEKKDA
jgi:hypothetical protein